MSGVTRRSLSKDASFAEIHDEFRERDEEVGDQPVVGGLKYRRFFVL